MKYKILPTLSLMCVTCMLSSIPLVAASCQARSHTDTKTPNRPATSAECRTDEMKSLIQRHSSSEDSDELEASRLSFSSVFDICPTEAIKLTLNAGLDGEMIGRMVSALPISFVDRPCAVTQELKERQGHLSVAMQELNDARLKDAALFLEHLVLINSKACRLDEE